MGNCHYYHCKMQLYHEQGEAATTKSTITTDLILCLTIFYFILTCKKNSHE